MRYTFLILDTYHPDILYLREQEEDPWLFFEAKKCPRKKNFRKHSSNNFAWWLFTQFLTYNLFYKESFKITHNCRRQLVHISVFGRQKLHHFFFKLWPCISILCIWTDVHSERYRIFSTVTGQHILPRVTTDGQPTYNNRKCIKKEWLDTAASVTQEMPRVVDFL
jgi:hypothetical protein